MNNEEEFGFSKEDSLDRLDKKLFNPKSKLDSIARRHSSLGASKEDIPSNWTIDENINNSKAGSKFSFSFSLLIFSLLVLIVTGLFATWNIYNKKNVVSDQNIDILLDVKPYIEGGEETPLLISIQNRNAITITNTELVISYEKGSGGQNQKEKINNKTILGDIKKNQLIRNDSVIQLFGAEGESRSITVELNYQVVGSNAVFKKTVNTSIILQTPPVSIRIEGMDKISNFKTVNYTLRVKNNTQKLIDTILVVATFPNNFKITETQPASRGYNVNTWALPLLKEGEERTITIEGVLQGALGENENIKAEVGSASNNQYEIGTIYSYDIKNLISSSSELKINMSANTDRGQVSSFRFGDKVKVAIEYENISDHVLENVEIKGIFSSYVIDTNSVFANGGTYDNNQKTIIWNNLNSPALSRLNIGEKGIVYVDFNILPNGNQSSFVRLDMTGYGTGINSANSETHLSTSMQWSIQGDISLTTHTIYSGSLFLNSGPIPPAVGLPTTYTLLFIASSKNALQKGTISFNLPSYVTWLNKTTPGENVFYSEKTRTVSWEILNTKEGQTKSLEVQVAFKPTDSHIGNIPAITSGVSFSSLDVNNISSKIVSKALSTELISPENDKEKWTVVK